MDRALQLNELIPLPWLLVGLEAFLAELPSYNLLLRYAWLEIHEGLYLANEALARSAFATLSTYPADVHTMDEIRSAHAFASEHEVGPQAAPVLRSCRWLKSTRDEQHCCPSAGGGIGLSRTPRLVPATRLHPHRVPAVVVPPSTGLDGVDYDCYNFATQGVAQAYFEADGGSISNNADGLDRNQNGFACEPGKFS